MRQHLLLMACLALVGIALWFSGVWLRGYHIAILTLAFLADYLTPEKYHAQAIDQAWHHWWQIGDEQRRSLYLHDSALQHVTIAYVQFAGIVVILAGAFLFPWRTMKLKASTVHGSAHWASKPQGCAHPAEGSWEENSHKEFPRNQSALSPD